MRLINLLVLGVIWYGNLILMVNMFFFFNVSLSVAVYLAVSVSVFFVEADSSFVLIQFLIFFLYFIFAALLYIQNRLKHLSRFDSHRNFI